MPAVRLGKMVLRWCNNCITPILNLKRCSVCGEKTHQVTYTPPGDIRPAFDFDIELIKRKIDDQFGNGCGEQFIPRDSVVILNRAPDLDRLDEVIFAGQVQGALKYDLSQERFRFLLRISGAQRFLKNISKGYVIVDDGAINPILTGSSALAPGVAAASDGIEVGDEVLVLSNARELLGVGSAYMSTTEMLFKPRGVSVKVRWHQRKPENDPGDTPKSIAIDSSIHPEHSKRFDNKIKNNIDNEKSWLSAIKSNRSELNRIVSDAKKFISASIERYQLPIAVSFSGGKDSLAVLLLVLETGIKPNLFFIDTGLEFPETVRHVKNISKNFGLKLITGKPANTFWDALEYFGPPGKDYRWCCKTCKLGPATRLIKKHFPKGVLMFIGQRRYESEERSSKGMVWRNPWVPGQIGASPIQDWSALHIWLYLFNKGVEYNRLYERGLERIGCWLCPASDMADFKMVSQHHPDYGKWLNYLIKYSKSRSFTSNWVEIGMWRWKKLPKGIENLIREKNIEVCARPKETAEGRDKDIDKDKLTVKSKIDKTSPLKLYLAEGLSDCKFGLSLEGAFNKELDIDRVRNLAHILGEVRFNDIEGYCTINETIDIFPEGGIVVKGKNASEIKKSVKKLHAVVLRAMECIGCGICLGRCENQALRLDRSDMLERIKLDEARCVHCGDCLGLCPVVNFNAAEPFEM